MKMPKSCLSVISTSEDLHGPGDDGFWMAIHQTQKGNIGLTSSHHFGHFFFQVHSRRNCRESLGKVLLKSHIVIDISTVY